MAGGHAPRLPIRRRRGHKTGRKDNKLPQGCRGCSESPTPPKKRGMGGQPRYPARPTTSRPARELRREQFRAAAAWSHAQETVSRRLPKKRHLQHLTTWGRGTLHHDYEPLKEEGSRTGHTHRSSWKGGQSSLHPGRLPPAYRAGAEPRRGHLIWHCCGRESKKSHGRAAGTRLGPLTNKQTLLLRDSNDRTSINGET